MKVTLLLAHSGTYQPRRNASTLILSPLHNGSQNHTEKRTLAWFINSWAGLISSSSGRFRQR